jgi:hypothetical protein
MKKARSGGGISSNKVVQSRAGYKVEPQANKASPAGADGLGQAVQFKKDALIQAGKGYNPAPVPPTGAPGKYNSAWQGPGSGRTVYGRGSQSTYGPVNPGERNVAPDPPATGTRGRDILSGYGPEATNKGR